MGYPLYFSQGRKNLIGISCGHKKCWFIRRTNYLFWVQNLDKLASKYKDKSLYDNHESKLVGNTAYKYLLNLDHLIPNSNLYYDHSPEVNVWCSFLCLNPLWSIFKIWSRAITNKWLLSYLFSSSLLLGISY